MKPPTSGGSTCAKSSGPSSDGSSPTATKPKPLRQWRATSRRRGRRACPAHRPSRGRLRRSGPSSSICGSRRPGPPPRFPRPPQTMWLRMATLSCRRQTPTSSAGSTRRRTTTTTAATRSRNRRVRSWRRRVRRLRSRTPCKGRPRPTRRRCFLRRLSSTRERRSRRVWRGSAGCGRPTSRATRNASSIRSCASASPSPLTQMALPSAASPTNMTPRCRGRASARASSRSTARCSTASPQTQSRSSSASRRGRSSSSFDDRGRRPHPRSSCGDICILISYRDPLNSADALSRRIARAALAALHGAQCAAASLCAHAADAAGHARAATSFLSCLRKASSSWSSMSWTYAAMTRSSCVTPDFGPYAWSCSKSAGIATVWQTNSKTARFGAGTSWSVSAGV
mmetsp:Transcript_43/g.160  ORF Transcript_43/g.160 Transcript_43/m.160 type:complete len:398 (+) Transcript_43:556-1749(+)